MKKFIKFEFSIYGQ